MDTWSIIYEYCDDPACAKAPSGRHPTCTRQHTVVIQERISVPQINLLDALTGNRSHVEHVQARRKQALAWATTRSPRRKTVIFRMPIPLAQFVGLVLLSLGLGGMIGPMIPELRLEASYLSNRVKVAVQTSLAERIPPLPKSAPIVFEPLEAPDGTIITPVSNDFSLIIPKIGVNAPVIGNVDPTKPKDYDQALLNGVAHASTSFFPDQNGTVYLFSHSTNYEWFVKDLNAVFYLVKNLNRGDTVVLIYKGTRYTYMISGKQVVAATKTGYLYPTAGRRSLILETCWPPGSTAERLLIFADPVGTKGTQI